MRKRTKARLLHRLGAWALTLALVVGLLPQTAFATDTGKAIQLVDSGTAANISGEQADNIYFGTYKQSSDGSGGYNTDPIKWRVLSNSDGKLFLLSDQNLDVQPYNSSVTSITWERSTIRSWLNGYFINVAFSSDEQTAIAETHVYNKTQSDRSSNPNPSYDTPGGRDTTDKIFLLSIEEANNSDYFPNGDSSRISTNTAYVASDNEMFPVGAAGSWWLRSPGFNDYYAAYVIYGGGVAHYGNYAADPFAAVRPAFNLDLDSVLFTSAAEGGKSATGMDSGLTAVNDYAGSEWKLTLLDEAHKDFNISKATITDTITFSYSGAATGTNEYISAVVVDNGAITHYGRILQIDGTMNGESGTANFTLPEGVTLSDTVKLYVFNEQYNGDKKTDYASAFEAVTNAPKLSNGSATRDSETTATVKFTSDEAGSYYYVVDNNATAPDRIDTTTTAGTSCNANEETTITLDSLSKGVQYIHIVVKDAEGNVSQPLTIQIPAYKFTVTVNVDPLEGGIAYADPYAAAEGTEVELTARPKTGYYFKEWQVTEGTVSIGNDNKFTMPAEDVTVKAVFEEPNVIMLGTEHLKGEQVKSTYFQGAPADNIYFGTYQQSSDGSGGYNTDPIKWRVLSNSDGKLFLLSDQNLDVKKYNSIYTSTTWENSTIRSWLNGYAASENNSREDYSSDNFIDTAFSSDEQTAIADTYVYNYNKNNPVYDTPGGEDTTDKIFLLSIEEAESDSYFPNANNSRMSTNTAYVENFGVRAYWWLRSPGTSEYYAALVLFGGGVHYNGYIIIDPSFAAVRPAFNLIKPPIWCVYSKSHRRFIQNSG